MGEESFERPPAVAGMFYPFDPPELRETVEKLLLEVPERRIDGEIRGLVVPHAGYVYSGFTAAHAYGLLRNESFETVILVGPSHREYFDGISVFPGAGYTTPLGAVRVDAEVREELTSSSDMISDLMAGHREEHCLEVQLPFLQVVLSHFTIVPIIIGDQRRDYCLELGEAIARVSSKRNVLVVASSDLSHYYPSDIAAVLDKRAIQSLSDMNEVQLLDDLETNRTEACGGGPIAAVVSAAKKLGADKCTILHSCNSGDISGDHDRVVGYVSAALWKVL